MQKLNKRQQLFADEYLLDCNATRAAIKAGYNSKNPAATASRLISKPEIKAYINEQLDKLHNKKIADVDEVMRYLTSVLRNEPDIYSLEPGENNFDKLDSIHADISLQDKKKDIPVKERIRAAELLGKRYGMFTDRLNLEAGVNIQILDDIPE